MTFVEESTCLDELALDEEAIVVSGFRHIERNGYRDLRLAGCPSGRSARILVPGV